MFNINFLNQWPLEIRISNKFQDQVREILKDTNQSYVVVCTEKDDSDEFFGEYTIYSIVIPKTNFATGYMYLGTRFAPILKEQATMALKKYKHGK